MYFSKMTVVTYIIFFCSLLIFCDKDVQKLSYYVYSQNKEIVVTYEGDQSDPQHIMISGFKYCDEEYLNENTYTVIYYFDAVKYEARILRANYKKAKNNKEILLYTKIETFWGIYG